MRFQSVVGIIVVAVACSRGKEPEPASPAPVAPSPTEGEARLAVPGGTIWYRVSGTGSATPVVLLHGGPGLSSFYLKPFEELGDDRKVVRYDQLGSGKSDNLTDTTAITIDHFVRELDSLRAHLGYAKWHVFGHSWGTIVALEYYRAYPTRVASLVFGSAVFDYPAYERHVKGLLATLPDSIQRAVQRAEAAHRYDDPGYQNAMNQFYSLYLVRHPVQADSDSTFATFNQTIYNYLQGPSEFTVTGKLKTYNTVSFLPQIRVPTLLTAGEFDEVGPSLIKGFAAKIPGARYVEFPGAAHLTSWDAREENIKVVREFLRSADSAR